MKTGSQDVTASHAPGQTLGVITLWTDAAREWVEDNVHTEPYMWLGSTLAVEWRYYEDIVAGMEGAGLRVVRA